MCNQLKRIVYQITSTGKTVQIPAIHIFISKLNS